MNFQHILPFVFVVLMFFALGSFVFRIIKNGGFKGAMFGAPIKSTVGEVKGTSPSRIMNLTLRVHRLGGDNPEVAVGLELVATSVGSYQMLPIALSKEEAGKLMDLLNSAVHGF